MSDATVTTGSKPNKAMLWTGRVLSTLPALLLLISSAMKLTKSDEVVKGFGEFGFDSSLIVPIGIVELVCTLLYIIPGTSVLGAILLTGYLGGAIVTHVRAADGMFFSPALIGIVLWLGLYLRDARLHALMPWKS
jgi:hypothetical protein